MSVTSIFNSVREYLASQYMYADDEWLLGCVEYLTGASNNLTDIEINNLAKQQWLLNDLKDICPGCLPANLQGQVKTTLSGRYVLQINAAIDIGTPAYQQYLKLQKVNMENVEATTKFEDKIGSHRMIKLYLTDGVQDITAIEYKTMRNLTCDITPGSKILVKGPVDCRRGVILLTENSIELLGGEVSDIAESNCLAGLLSSKLGLPRVQESEHNMTIRHASNTTIPTLHTEMPPPDPEQPKPVAIVTCLQAFNDDIDIDQIAEIEKQLQRETNKRPCTEENTEPEKKFKTENRPEDYPDDDDDIFFNEDEDYLRQIEDQIDKYNDSITYKTGFNTSLNKPMLIDSTAKNIDRHKEVGNINKATDSGVKFDTKKPEVAVQPLNFPICVAQEPYIFIKQILDLSDIEQAGRVFKVKAQIIKLLSKLFLGKDGWCLKCTIVDGTGSLDVDFTSEVLSNLVGYTPQEMNQLKKQMPSKPELREKAVEALQNVRDKLQVLYCIMELTMLEVPKITNLIPFGPDHAELLNRRFQSTRLNK